MVVAWEKIKCFSEVGLMLVIINHVSCSEEIEGTNQVQHQHRQNKFIPLSEGVTACTVHPLTGTIVAGTKVSSTYNFHLPIQFLVM